VFIQRLGIFPVIEKMIFSINITGNPQS
jgi:hypothetical protein